MDNYGTHKTLEVNAGNKRIWKNSEFMFWAGARMGRYTLSASGFVNTAPKLRLKR